MKARDWARPGGVLWLASGRHAALVPDASSAAPGRRSWMPINWVLFCRVPVPGAAAPTALRWLMPGLGCLCVPSTVHRNGGRLVPRLWHHLGPMVARWARKPDRGCSAPGQWPRAGLGVGRGLGLGLRLGVLDTATARARGKGRAGARAAQAWARAGTGELLRIDKQ